ncbi:MAG TPA: hypothetical protein VM599_06715 [Thermoanaerobaculia bacterium]|nr:hypothetical protein [Thermoanaerobaculia bacterium]
MARDQGRHDGLEEVSGTVYGVELRGRLPAAFRPYLASPAGEPAGPAGSLEVGYGPLDRLPEVEEIWASEAAGPGGRVRLGLFRPPEGFGLTVSAEGEGLFRCAPRAARIEWRPPGTGAPHYFFSYALPLWLETRGVPVLHGSAVGFGGRAVAFLGRSGVGKSVLCAELLRLGCGFLADDALALYRDEGRAEGPDARGAWRCAPGPPLLRLWPSGLERRLEIAADALPKVHRSLEKRQLLLGGEGAAPPASGLPLAAVYVLLRRPEAGGPVRTTAGGPRDALVRLLEHGVAAAPAAALGLARQRLELLADVVEKVPVRLLSFPSGSDSAPRIRQAILRDLEDMS